MTMAAFTLAVQPVAFEIVSHLKSHPLDRELHRQLAARLRQAGAPTETARALVEHFGRQQLALPVLDAVAAVVRFHAFLQGVFGRAGTNQAIASALASRRSEHSSTLCVLSRTAGIPCGVRPDSREGGRFRALLHELSARVRTGGVDLWDAACYIAGVPGIDLPELTSAILARVADHPNVWPFAACLLLGPGDDPVKSRAVAWLGRQFGHQALPMLERLTEDNAGVAAFAAARREAVRLANVARGPNRGPALAPDGLPFDWPTVAAYASRVEDGTWHYLVRRMPDGRQAMIGALVTRDRGITNATGDAGAPAEHLGAFFEGVAASPSGLRTVPPRVSLTRIRNGIRTSARLDLPLPFEFRAWRHILAGL